MLGTIVNTTTIIIGSTTGALLKKGIKEEYSDVLFTAMGLASVGLGLNAVAQNMPKSVYPVLFIVSLALGGLIGTILDIDGAFKRLVDRFQKKTENDEEASAAGQMAEGQGQSSAESIENAGGKGRLSEGLSTGILLYCIGTLSILGPIQSALYGDHTYLLTNATLDLVTSAVLASTYGIGMILAAPVLFCWQGSIYLLACLLGNFMTQDLMTEISIVGGFLIASSGVSILRLRQIKTLNFLPSLLVPVAWVIIRGIFIKYL